MSDDFQQRGGSPWGSPPGGGGSGNGSGRGPRPPDIDKIIKGMDDDDTVVKNLQCLYIVADN